MPQRLLVLGAGPKGIALAAKARVLSECGYSVPEIEIIEKNGVGANWAGGFGYTDGQQLLETPPEKDIGFPYSSKEYPPEVDMRMFQEYSWHTFLIENGLQGLSGYSERVDRGREIRPRLTEWAEYLKWIAGKCKARVTEGDVIALNPSPDGWTVTYAAPGGKRSTHGDGLVITGPGPSKAINGQPKHSRVLDGVSFWRELRNMKSMSHDDDPIGIVGSGGAAASTILALARTLENPVPILVINRGGAIFSRGESYWENRVFSDPDECVWDELPMEDRVEFIKRTNRGVFSLAALDFISGLSNVRYVPMEVKGIEIEKMSDVEAEGRPVMIGHNRLRVPVRYAVIAIGFDPWWFWSLMSDKNVQALLRFSDNQRTLEQHIGRDLSFDNNRISTPPLHVPMLAAAAQGPGFPTLNCLGLLADRILSRYARPRGGVA